MPSIFDDGSECRLSCCRLFSLRHVRLTLYRLFVKLWVGVSKMGKEVGGVPFFVHHDFPTLLHIGLCSSLGTGSPFSSAVRPKYTHTTLLAFFFLTKVAGNSAISLRTKSSRSHAASCLVSCRVASPTFSSVSLWYTSETIYRDKENACDMIITLSQLSRLYRDTGASPTPTPHSDTVHPGVLAHTAPPYFPQQR